MRSSSSRTTAGCRSGSKGARATPGNLRGLDSSFSKSSIATKSGSLPLHSTRTTTSAFQNRPAKSFLNPISSSCTIRPLRTVLESFRKSSTSPPLLQNFKGSEKTTLTSASSQLKRKKLMTQRSLQRGYSIRNFLVLPLLFHRGEKHFPILLIRGRCQSLHLEALFQTTKSNIGYQLTKTLQSSSFSK